MSPEFQRLKGHQKGLVLEAAQDNNIMIVQGANTGNATTNPKAGSLLDKVTIRNALSVLGKNAGVAKEAGLKYVLVSLV